MSRINLLPWREEQRKIQNRIFFAMAGSAVLVGIILLFLMHWIFSYRTAIENANVDYLNKELKGITGEIVQIQGLQENKENLLNRMRIIQSLQEDRGSIVKLLDIIPKVVPEGVYLLSMTRLEVKTALPANSNNKETALDNKKTAELINKEYQVEILGVAQTNSGISNLMKNLQEVKWITDIKYNEVSVSKSGEGLNFKLAFIQKTHSEIPSGVTHKKQPTEKGNK